MKLTGVLAIFLTLTLLVLSSFSVTTARSNLSYSKAARDRHAQFYELDADAQRLLMYVHTSLKEAHRLSDIETDKNYITLAHKQLEDGKLIFLRSLLMEKERASDWQGPDLSILTLSDEDIISDIKIQATFFAETNKNYHLTVTIDVLPQSRINAAEEYYYDIVEWRQWQ